MIWCYSKRYDKNNIYFLSALIYQINKFSYIYTWTNHLTLQDQAARLEQCQQCIPNNKNKIGIVYICANNTTGKEYCRGILRASFLRSSLPNGFSNWQLAPTVSQIGRAGQGGDKTTWHVWVGKDQERKRKLSRCICAYACALFSTRGLGQVVPTADG